MQTWALHYFVCRSWSEGIVSFFSWRKIKNFKGLKVHVLKHKTHNNIVLMASAVGWTLQEKNERKSLAIPHEMVLSILFTASILFPLGIYCSHVHFSLVRDRPSSLFWPGTYTVLCVSGSGVRSCLCLVLLRKILVFLGCLEHSYMASFSV